MALTNSNLYSEIYNEVKTFLDSLILDPRGRYKANWIHPTLPSINSKGFDGYPFIILQVNVTENDKSFDRATQKTFRVNLIVYSDQDTEVDTICNSIRSGLESWTDFQAIEIATSNFNWDMDQNGKKIRYRNMGVILKTRI